MTKSEYYKLSEDKKLPLRCPCLSNCSRYKFTAYFVGRTCYTPKSNNDEDNMREMGIIDKNESIFKMLNVGEPVVYTGGNRNFYITNACPEFFLHNHEHKLAGMEEIATHQFSYDEDYRGSKFRPGESRHYTECPEYSLFISKKGVANVRKKIAPKIRAELQKEIYSRCPFCSNEEVGHFEIHHIDENPANNIITNLIMLCPICHSKITKGDISKKDVIFKKRALNNNAEKSETAFDSKESFQKKISKLIAQTDSIYYSELKNHWNTYSLIHSSPLLNEVLNNSIANSIEFGLLSLISDIVSNHLYYDKDSKYVYNQQHVYMHNRENEGYNLPIFYHIRFIGILYATAIHNKIDIDTISNQHGNMQSIYSSMIKGIIDNLDADKVDNTKEYPTNFHWLVGEIFDTMSNWLDEFNEKNNFDNTSSYVDFIPSSINYCLAELYMAEQKGKINQEFLIRQVYYGILTDYFSSLLNNDLRESIETNIIVDIPSKYIQPIFEFSLDEKFAMRYKNFCEGKFKIANEKEGQILTRLRNFLIQNNKI